MKTLLLILASVSIASAQLVPKAVVTLELPTQKAADDEKTRQLSEQAKEVAEKDALDVEPKVVAIGPSGKPVVHTTRHFDSKATAVSLEDFVKAGAFPKGSFIRIESHLCPHTNEPPKGWLGCKLDPRAENSVTEVKP